MLKLKINDLIENIAFKIVCLVFLILFNITGGYAGNKNLELPKYDIEKYCKMLSSIPSSLPGEYEHCKQSENYGKNELEGVWDRLDEKIKQDCLKWVKSTGKIAAGYGALDGCIISGIYQR